MTGTWIEVDLDAVVGNYREIIKQLRPGARCMAVVKADGYGLGAVEVARALEREGCEAFAVTKVEEGLVLREHGIKGIILVLGPTIKEEWEQAIKAELQLTLSEISWVDELNAASARMEEEGFPQVKVHLKLETGMGRTGFWPAELEGLAKVLGRASHIEVVGAYTHFARAAQRDKRYTLEQYKRFQESLTCLRDLGISPLWQHVCNSAAFLDYPEWHHSFVRIGTLLVGHYPGEGFAGRINLRDPWTAKSRVVQLRKVPKGTFVGYQSIFRTKSETQLAVIPVGYADGFGVTPHFVPQGLIDFIKIVIKNFAALLGITLGQERVVLKGRSIRVAGKIGMQLTVLDIGNENCVLGDEVKIPLRRTLANPRIPRIYRQDEQILSKRVIKEGVLPLYTEYSSMTET
ncbi:alanine racemase [Desulfosporosinus acidiphilus SJ4]|uniref:Alanine racemase n=1 Tax=Desulfosporosinus acidiphilus (strain DSM 22704 / JCM 16185 / SJ4) TaxID=646529 RepID=I4DCG2_DESAJ|nr:alanine racemase [Desulfosporosinus acidiphilus]AFM43486.1 alanine racemase [Desulfosporosinus acidiphilus SJ4]